MGPQQNSDCAPREAHQGSMSHVVHGLWNPPGQVWAECGLGTSMTALQSYQPQNSYRLSSILCLRPIEELSEHDSQSDQDSYMYQTPIDLVHIPGVAQTIKLQFYPYQVNQSLKCWICRLQAMCFSLYMAQSVVLINNKDYFSPSLYLACSYIICYSRIYEMSDLFIIYDLVVLSLSNTQMIRSPIL